MKPELIWLDLETTGLDTFARILEIGIRLTDKYGNDLGQFTSLLWEDSYKEELKTGMSEYVQLMHSKSGLLHELKDAPYPRFQYETRAVERRAINWLEVNGVDSGVLPMAGSSVHFDRSKLKQYMPSLENFFHYRNLDISSLKIACSQLNQSVFEKLPEAEAPHRPQGCISKAISEYQYYQENFLWLEDDDE